ncbi:hypothetical protein [Endozoicomonas sp.]|uniref:hypothetical protein n=1 Tax=Endozoicomonas sp. TaxID=1892382 RepID=UPI00383A4F99
MKMKIIVKMDNAAFDPEENLQGVELARVLRKLASQVEDATFETGDRFLVADINGNKALDARIEE